MKKTFLFFFILMILSVICIASRVSAANRGISVVSKQGQSLHFYNDYQALVVGVSNYELWPKLPNAVNDAVDVARKFRGMGIHVNLILDPTYRELKTALTDMVYEMGREQNRGVLFYYAGHGETETLADGRKMGYIIPRDCPLLRNDPRGFANHAISMREIESASLRIRSKHVLMLFDSCFSGALFAMVRAVPHDITEKSTLPVRQYITAGREDEEVPDQSMFKRCLLIGLEGDADLTGDGYITGSELGMYLADKVVNYTHRQQHPQYGKINNPDLDRGDFVLSLAKSVSLPQQAPQSVRRFQAPSESQGLREERAKLERERRELEEIRALIAERKSLEAEKKKYNLAKLPAKPKQPPSVSAIQKDGETASDGSFIAYANGTVVDTKTNLMWAGASSGSSLSKYSDAEDYCERYSGGGYKDWRMPTIDELNSLYNENLSNDQGYHVTKFISLGGDYVWGKQNSWGGTGVFNFKTRTSELGYHEVYGNRIFGDGLINLDPMALPVRTKN
jgi:hypothetical protein